MKAPDSCRIAATAERLRVDDWTAEIVEAMSEHGIRTLLLKGPSVGRWLYDDDAMLRPYRDVDLMVSPDDTEPARALLDALGFIPLPYPPADDHALHARPYRRETDGASVDLHRRLHGLQSVSPSHAWELVSRGAVPIRVGGVEVEVLGIPARLLNVVLHIGAHDARGSQAWTDLERALERVPVEDWRAAVAMAAELGAEDEMALRLRCLPEGARLADALDLSSGATWQPRRLARGAGLVTLLANTVPARERPEECLKVLSRALEGVTVLEGDRGEAGPVAAALLAQFVSGIEMNS